MNISDFHFIRPYYLLALIPLVVFIVFALKNKLKQGDWNEVCDVELLPYILQQTPSKQSHWMLVTLSLVGLLAVIALAGPTWQRLDSPVFRNDAALIIALNLSQTMDAQDIKPSRVARARYKIADILRQRKDGLTALLVYSGDAFTVTPLTADVATIENQLNALETSIMPSSGNNTAAAIKLAVQLLQQGAQQQGDIFLITDGVGEQDPDDLIKLVGHYNLSVLGVGTEQGAPVTLARGGFLKDSAGNIVLSSLPAGQLKSLANKGQGVYQQATLNDDDINALMAGLNKASTADSKQQSSGVIEQWQEQGIWLLWLLLPLAALSFRKGFLSLALLLVLPLPQTSYAVSWQDLWLNKNQQAQQAFQHEEFEQAAELFESPKWKAAAQYKAGQYQQAADSLKGIDTVEAHYNRGNALAKAGQLEAALDAYQQALTRHPNNEDAAINLKKVEEALKQQKDKQQDKNQQKGEQKSDKPSDDSQQDKQQQNEQSQNEQSQNEQSQNEQSQNEQSQNEQSQNEQSQNEQSQNEQSQNEQSQNEQSQNEQEEQADTSEEGAAQAEPEPSEGVSDEQKEQAVQSATSEEQKQANEQWLKRIKDDPAGLLKRKFKYQYGQRRQQQ